MSTRVFKRFFRRDTLPHAIIFIFTILSKSFLKLTYKTILQIFYGSKTGKCQIHAAMVLTFFIFEPMLLILRSIFERIGRKMLV